ncbi:hypothetical protein HALLA_12185 [Halostagnicola larsenii XH-48]|uniref:Uncharacterized protein n=1 Tax=Halostagnicola larsenii XH-48 TaxID=797299 RepID=W0JQC7_9EURY|nr:hypothetical protein HALLA_11875 [Halostagnicola larsenii XH-48]AHG00982.1 hypothetical protein HALLA_12185 [Halostagnicola larsenii XH-48]
MFADFRGEFRNDGVVGELIDLLPCEVALDLVDDVPIVESDYSSSSTHAHFVDSVDDSFTEFLQCIRDIVVE